MMDRVEIPPPCRSAMRHLLRHTLAILFAVSLTGYAAAQDPFGDDPADDLFAEETPVLDDAGDEAGEPPSPLVIQLNELAGRGNLPLADAIASLARIGRWSDVDRLLTVVDSRAINQAQLAEMARRIEPAILLRIESNDKVLDRAQNAVKTLRSALTAESQSVDRLRQAIDGLDDESIDVRLASTRTLLSGGNVAVAELVAAAVSPTPTAPRDDILGVMLKLGDGGTQGLRQISLYGQPPARRFAVESLARIDRTAAIPELLTALHAADSTSDEKASAQSILQRQSPSMPTRQATVIALFRELQRLRDIAARSKNDSRVNLVWSVDSGGQQVTYQPTRSILAAYRDATDAASRLRRIGGYSAEIARAVLSADMAYRLMIDPDWGDADQIEAVRQTFGSFADATTLLPAIGESLDRGDYPGLVGLLRMIDPESDPLVSYELLRSAGPVPTSLVAAASSSDPRVRYEAAGVIAKIAGSRPFAGSSRVRQTLSEMRSLDDLPTALLVETRYDVIVELERLLTELGFEVDVVGSVAQLQRRIDRGGDFRMILSKTELPDYSAIEMTDLVRRTRRGREVPIVFYGAEAAGIDSQRWKAPIIQIDRPRSSFGFQAIVTGIREQRRLPPLSPVDRQLYALSADGLLAKMATAR